MSVSMYDVSIPLFILSLNNLTAILGKAERFPGSDTVEPGVPVERGVRRTKCNATV
jgi:hypothetical protein